MKTLTNHRGSPNRNLPSRGFLKSEASSSLSRSKKLLLTKPLKSEGIIKDSQRQESSSHEASPRRGFVPKIPTSAETVGKAQEALSQGVQEGEALETRLKEVQQGGETSTELLQLEAEISPLKGKLREVEEAREKQKEVQEAWKEMESARQEMEQSAKRFDPLKAGN